MRPELKSILKRYKSDLLSSLTDGMLRSLLAELDEYFDDTDVERIKRELENKGPNYAAFELFSCLQKADDVSMRKLLKFLQRNKSKNDLFQKIARECELKGFWAEAKIEKNVSTEAPANEEMSLPRRSSKSSSTAQDQCLPFTLERQANGSPSSKENTKYPIQAKEEFSTLAETRDSQKGGEKSPVKSYKMTSCPKGICVIINNVDFSESRIKSQKGYDDRHGSDVDRRNLNEVFRWLGFDVKTYNNKNALEMWKVFLEWSKHDHSRFDCFVACILSHGKKNVKTNKDEVCGVDGKSFPVDDIIKNFTGDCCRSLIDKPKLFFFQTCRGLEADKGASTQSVVVADGVQNEVHSTLPLYCDFFIGFATPPGFKSWRNTVDGTWYISKLCEVLVQLARDYDLMSMMTKVNMEVSKFYTDKGCKQVPNPSMTLRKLLFFNPETHEPRSGLK